MMPTDVERIQIRRAQQEQAALKFAKDHSFGDVRVAEWLSFYFGPINGSECFLEGWLLEIPEAGLYLLWAIELESLQTDRRRLHQPVYPEGLLVYCPLCHDTVSDTQFDDLEQAAAAYEQHLGSCQLAA